MDLRVHKEQQVRRALMDLKDHKEMLGPKVLLVPRAQ